MASVAPFLYDAAVTESGSRTRTRRAILDAAVSVLSRRPTASLAEIADEAGVGRTTLHRYYPERSDLLDAISADALAQIAAAMRRARPADGSAREALLRLCRELFDLGELLTVVFSQILTPGRPEWEESSDTDNEMLHLVERGHRDGSISTALTPYWVHGLLWTTLYAADSYVRETGCSRHDALAMAVASLDGAIRPPA
jgi:TetR/AcrR family transcriptional regulator, repressor for lfrA